MTFSEYVSYYVFIDWIDDHTIILILSYIKYNLKKKVNYIFYHY